MYQVAANLGTGLPAAPRAAPRDRPARFGVGASSRPRAGFRRSAGHGPCRRR